VPETYVPECHIIMLGCKALDNVPPPPGACPVCGPGVAPGTTTATAPSATRSAPPSKNHINKSLRIEKIGVDSKSRAEVAENKARMKLQAIENQRRPLTEVERRRMWNGYRYGIMSELVDELTNTAKDVPRLALG
jgi:hypothetical protein